MNEVTVIGIDLAKNMFQLHGVDARGTCILRKKIRRDHVARFFSTLPTCLVGMEACAGSGYWARVIGSFGHTVRRMHPRFVKPYLMSNKNDANDAAAICEAVQRPRMRFVPNKTQEQADIQAMHRVRQRLIQDRTAAINQIRGLLAENGIVLRQGARHVRTQLAMTMDDASNDLSGAMRGQLRLLHEKLVHLEEQIARQNVLLSSIAENNDVCRRLLKVPGVGVLSATILLAVAGAAKEFKNGREFAAYLGLVPRQHSTGGKPRLLGITKQGDGYARMLLVSGARSVLRCIRMGHTSLGARTDWASKLMDRRGHNKTCVALANKTARIVWSMLRHGTEYEAAA